ncbi:vesicular glutamate transporter 3 [Plakobranchus ocellatus]|uniref:Vesicular glutamate transporter 3 n=1 Tax=Plakobranchus ocellatus TaxID=259542 RepID=A0AAV4CM44_9GAST|nr:vesicular glutamate transporter 3 [Plakobranchus ocellatus]
MCLGQCNSDSRYSSEDCMSGVIFRPFPKPKTQLEKCREWIRLCNHPHTDLSFDKTGDINPQHYREFQWGSTFEGVVLSSYYYGYLLTPLLSGYLERVVGAKCLVAVCIGLGSLVNLLTPFLTRVDRFLLVVLRVLAGTTNGMIDPAVQSLWSAWAPRSEVAYLTAVEYAGLYKF